MFCFVPSFLWQSAMLPLWTRLRWCFLKWLTIPDDHHGDSNHGKLDPLISYVFRLTKNYFWFPSQRASNVESITMSCDISTNAAEFQLLTHPPNVFSRMKSFLFWFEFHWSLFISPIDNTWPLVEMMAWCRTGDKPLSNADRVNRRMYAALGANELIFSHCVVVSIDVPKQCSSVGYMICCVWLVWSETLTCR